MESISVGAGILCNFGRGTLGSDNQNHRFRAGTLLHRWDSYSIDGVHF